MYIYSWKGYFVQSPLEIEQKKVIILAEICLKGKVISDNGVLLEVL